MAQIQRAAAMLEHPGYSEAGKAIRHAFETVRTEGQVQTPDLGGKASTMDVAQAVVTVVTG